MHKYINPSINRYQIYEWMMLKFKHLCKSMLQQFYLSVECANKKGSPTVAGLGTHEKKYLFISYTFRAMDFFLNANSFNMLQYIQRMPPAANITDENVFKFNYTKVDDTQHPPFIQNAFKVIKMSKTPKNSMDIHPHIYTHCTYKNNR